MSKTNFTVFFYSLDKHSNLLAVYYSSELVGGVCNFLGSVLPPQRFEMVDQCYSLVTAQGVIGQAKERTSLRHEGGSTPKKRRQSICLGFLLLYTLSAPPSLSPSLHYANWASQEQACLFHLRFSLWSEDFLLFHFLRLFPFFVF